MTTNPNGIRPFLSILTIIITLLGLVFFKIELRQMGYSILRLSREHRAALDEQRSQMMTFARLTRPGRVEQLAHLQFDLQKAGKGQIIQMGQRVVFKP